MSAEEDPQPGKPAIQDGSPDPSTSAAAAALVIQKQYRGYRTRRALEGQTLSPDAKWADVLHSMKLRSAERSARKGDGQKDAASRWKRGGVLVGQLAGSPGSEGKAGPFGGPGKKEKDQDEESEKMGPVEGGPSLQAANEHMEQGEGEAKLGADVPGADEDGKIDNVHPIAGKRQIGLKLIERWTSGAEGQALSKIMEAQYWLEMVDSKHRYGSNLKHYHKVWTESETQDNFFRWLDEGEGRKLDLDECPRERLDRERITYLNAEQRRNYIVDIKDGKLVWRRNGKLVDTSKNHKDLGNGQGIVEMGPEEIEERKRIRKQRRESRKFVKGSSRAGRKVKGKAKGKVELKEKSGDGSEERLDGDQEVEEDLYSSCSSDSDSSGSSSDESDDGDDSGSKSRRKAEAHHYGGEASKKEKRMGLLNSKNWTDALLRKTVGSNTWIYVLNARYELYVGRKTTGQFQHSSFLYGGRVLSAGLLRVKKGHLVSLSPLSGHYRAGTAHFRYFVSSLQKSGVDLSGVTLSKSLLMLYGLEEYGKWTGKAKGKDEEDKDKGTRKDGKEKEKEAKKEKRGSAFLGGLLRIGHKEKEKDKGKDKDEEDERAQGSARPSVEEDSRSGRTGKRGSMHGRSKALLTPAAAVGKSERGRPRSIVSLDHLKNWAPVAGTGSSENVAPKTTSGSDSLQPTRSSLSSATTNQDPSASSSALNRVGTSRGSHTTTTAGNGVRPQTVISPELAALTASWDQARHPSPHRLAHAASRSEGMSSLRTTTTAGTGTSAGTGTGAPMGMGVEEQLQMRERMEDPQERREMDRPRTLLERLGVMGRGG